MKKIVLIICIFVIFGCSKVEKENIIISNDFPMHEKYMHEFMKQPYGKLLDVSKEENGLYIIIYEEVTEQQFDEYEEILIKNKMILNDSDEIEEEKTRKYSNDEVSIKITFYNGLDEISYMVMNIWKGNIFE